MGISTHAQTPATDRSHTSVPAHRAVPADAMAVGRGGQPDEPRPHAHERRRSQRHTVALDLTLLSATEDALAMGRIVDLCRGGARVEGLPLNGRFDCTHVPLVPDTAIRIAVHVADGQDPLVLRGSVQWRRGRGSWPRSGPTYARGGATADWRRAALHATKPVRPSTTRPFRLQQPVRLVSSPDRSPAERPRRDVRDRLAYPPQRRALRVSRMRSAASTTPVPSAQCVAIACRRTGCRGNGCVRVGLHKHRAAPYPRNGSDPIVASAEQQSTYYLLCALRTRRRRTHSQGEATTMACVRVIETDGVGDRHGNDNRGAAPCAELDPGRRGH
jgi:hypothetical protein